MKIAFWLLDVNSEVKSGIAEIWLWGVTDSEKRVLVIDRSFLAYFYAVIEEKTDPADVVKEIETCNLDSVVKLEVVDRKFFGKPIKAIKIYCRNPEVISRHARAVRNLEGVRDCLEDDVRYAMHYLIDNDIVPSTWHEADVKEEKEWKDLQVDCVYSAQSTPKKSAKIEVPKLKILGFSTIYYSREGTPKPERNPIVILSAVTNNSQVKQFIADEKKNDLSILKTFIDYVKESDPDVIVGYGVNKQDWHYLAGRCREHGLRLLVDRGKTEPHASVYGHVSLTGRANMDLQDYADEFPEVKVKTLENLADYLGIMKIEERTIIEDVDFPEYWDDLKKREQLKRFSSDSTKCVIGIAGAIMDFAVQLSSLVGFPLDHVGTAAAGFRVEWFIVKQTNSLGELVPKRIEQDYRSYTGAIVLSPKAGLHENIANLDFKSMYPNIMIAYNLSPDTYVGPKEPMPKEGVYEAPEVKHKFRKDPPGFYKEILSHLIVARDQIRSKMKNLTHNSMEYRVLDARQKAVKVITNASYGYTGWVGARWYVKPLAEAATAWGRYTILKATEIAEKEGLQVVYGDTDSLFVTNDERKIALFIQEVSSKLGMEIQLDKIYVRIFFTQAKKRYAGILPDGRLDIVGLEVARGDWAAVAKKVQEGVLEIILRGQRPQEAADYVKHFIIELRKRTVPYRDLVIWKTLTKPAEEYQVKSSHVEAAKMLQQKGWELGVGDKIGYVVISGTGRLYNRVKPYVFASYDEIDLDYYVSKQVVPAAARILESFGIAEEQLLASKNEATKSKKITEFLDG